MVINNFSQHEERTRQARCKVIPLPLTVHPHPEVDPDGQRAGDQRAAEGHLPLSGRGLDLGERLPEREAVQLLDLLLGQLLPVALLLLTQRLARGRREGRGNEETGSGNSSPVIVHGWARESMRLARRVILARQRYLQ